MPNGGHAPCNVGKDSDPVLLMLLYFVVSSTPFDQIAMLIAGSPLVTGRTGLSISDVRFHGRFRREGEQVANIAVSKRMTTTGSR